MGHLTVLRPAPMLEARALLEPITRGKPLLAMTATYQLALGDTHGLAIDGRLLAVIGFWPLGEGREEVFLAGRPPEEVAPHLAKLRGACRLILAARPHSAGGRRLTAHVALANRAGARLARLAGFVLAAVDGRFQEWTLDVGTCEKPFQPERSGGGGGGGGGLAARGLDDRATAPAAGGDR